MIQFESALQAARWINNSIIGESNQDDAMRQILNHKKINGTYKYKFDPDQTYKYYY